MAEHRSEPQPQDSRWVQIVKPIPGLPASYRWVGCIIDRDELLALNRVTRGEMALVDAHPECTRPADLSDGAPSPWAELGHPLAQPASPRPRAFSGRRTLPEFPRLHRG